MSGIPLSRKAFRSSKIREGDVELARLTSKSFRLLFFFLSPFFQESRPCSALMWRCLTRGPLFAARNVLGVSFSRGER